MTWLRLDDRFAENPKIVELSDREFRVWIRTLCYAARNERGEFTPAMCREVVGLTPATVDRFVEAGLLEPNGGTTFEVHDWRIYNPKDVTAAVRKRRQRDRDKGVT
jgi:hypothetical protein